MNVINAIARWLLAAFFIVAGANHLRDPALYLTMMPPYLPWPYALVIISGLAEVAGGIGLLIPTTRRWAGWGLILLLLAVFPANLHFALNNTQLPGMHLSPLVLWLRLPVQVPFIGWVWGSPCAPRGPNLLGEYLRGLVATCPDTMPSACAQRLRWASFD